MGYEPEGTCPSCRRPITTPDIQSGYCPNCGAEVDPWNTGIAGSQHEFP